MQFKILLSKLILLFLIFFAESHEIKEQSTFIYDINIGSSKTILLKNRIVILIKRSRLIRVVILIRTASFLQKFTVSENSPYMLFANDARQQLHNIFIQFGNNIQTERQLRNAVFC